MTNKEKYKTRKELKEAFEKFCNSHRRDCIDCQLFYKNESCTRMWMKLESGEKGEKQNG